MKSKKKNIILMLVILVLLVGAFIAVQVLNSKAEKEKETEEGEVVKVAITDYNSSQIAKVYYKFKDADTLSYKYVKDAWVNADDADFPLSSSAFANTFIDTFTGITTSREIEKDAKADLSQYGLADPYLTLNVENFGGEVETFYLGDYNSMLGEYYFMKSGDDKLYTIGTDLLYICRQDMYDYATLEAFPSYSKSTLNDITINNGETTVKMTYQANGYKTDLIGECKWFFSTPFSYYRSAETNKMNDLESDVLSLLQFTKLANYKATEEDIANYGLEDSKKQYIINYNDTDETAGTSVKCSSIVDFGNYDEATDSYYARVTKIRGGAKEVSDKVYLCSKASIDGVLGIDPLDYIYKQVIYVKLLDVDVEGGSIVYNTPDGEFTLENKTTIGSDGMPEEYFYYINGKEMDVKSVENFYYDILANCGAERLIYDKSTVVTDVEPTYTITYNRQVEDFYGKSVVVTYTKYDANYYQASVNGYTDVLVNKRLLDEAMAKLPSIADGTYEVTK
jgi:hypothetical protein